MTLCWSMPKDDGGAAVEKFMVERHGTSRTTWNIVDAVVECFNVAVIRLLKNHGYKLPNYGFNKFGIGQPLNSDPIIAKYQFTVPQAPLAPTKASCTKSTITIMWERPNHDGGHDIKVTTLSVVKSALWDWSDVIRLSSQNSDTRFKTWSRVTGTNSVSLLRTMPVLVQHQMLVH